MSSLTGENSHFHLLDISQTKGEIYGSRAEVALEEIEYLSNREKEPVLPLDAFDRDIRQSMMVDLGQFIETPELPLVERGVLWGVGKCFN